MTSTSVPAYTEHPSIPYPCASDPTRQALDLYLPPSSSSSSPLLVYIHGGAWRSEAKSDFQHTLVPSLITSTGLPVAVLEYRLAPTHAHTSQINDVLAALALLASPTLLEAEGGVQRWARTSLLLIGHSAGAFMGLSVVLKPATGTRALFVVDPVVRKAVAGLVLVDGIYDLPDLLAEYPDYSGFVEDAFGKDPSALEADSPARWGFATPDEGGRAMRMLVLHSNEDELLSLRQPEGLVARLGALEGGEAVLEVDYETLKGSHDDVVKRDELAGAVKGWLQGGGNVKAP